MSNIADDDGAEPITAASDKTVAFSVFSLFAGMPLGYMLGLGVLAVLSLGVGASWVWGFSVKCYQQASQLQRLLPTFEKNELNPRAWDVHKLDSISKGTEDVLTRSIQIKDKHFIKALSTVVLSASYSLGGEEFCVINDTINDKVNANGRDADFGNMEVIAEERFCGRCNNVHEKIGEEGDKCEVRCPAHLAGYSITDVGLNRSSVEHDTAAGTEGGLGARRAEGKETKKRVKEGSSVLLTLVNRRVSFQDLLPASNLGAPQQMQDETNAWQEAWASEHNKVCSVSYLSPPISLLASPHDALSKKTQGELIDDARDSEQESAESIHVLRPAKEDPPPPTVLPQSCPDALARNGYRERDREVYVSAPDVYVRQDLFALALPRGPGPSQFTTRIALMCKTMQKRADHN